MARARRTLDLTRAAAALTDDAGRPRSMAAIAAELGVAKPTLFKLAGSRAELEAACAEAEAERLLDRVATLEAATVWGWVEALTSAIEDLALPVLRDHPAVLRRVEVRLAARLGPVPGGIPADAAAAALLGAALALARR